MGLPDLDFLSIDSVAMARNAREKHIAKACYDKRHAILLFHLIGIVLFALALVPMTTPSLYGSFYWDSPDIIG